MKLEDKVNFLFDFAVMHPEGFTYPEVEEEYGWGRVTFYRVVRALRLELADITLPCTPQGAKEPWLYSLTASPDDARLWQNNRVDDCETRLETMESVAASLAEATDGRSIEGKKARKIARTLAYLRAELAEIES